MIAGMLYGSVGLMLLTVLSARYWRRQMAQSRQTQSKLRDRLDIQNVELLEMTTDHSQLTQQRDNLERKVTQAEREFEVTLQNFEEQKNAQTQRYYIFDRLEPRPGRFWEAIVVCTGQETPAWQGHRSWKGQRRFLLVAEAEREARERVASRFPRKNGYEVRAVSACQIEGLSVNLATEGGAPRRTPASGS